MTPQTGAPDALPPRGPGLLAVLREWGRIGCIGFGGPPAHIKLLRDLCVDKKQWLAAAEFEDAAGLLIALAGAPLPH